MRLLSLAIIGLFPFGLTVPSEACTAPPKKMRLSHEDAIADAEWIARVRADRRLEKEKDGMRGYRLKVIEYLKGSGPMTIDIESESWWSDPPLGDRPSPVDSNFYGHHASEFWVHGGRSLVSTDCRVHPHFLFGEFEYLIFGPAQYNVGFENITLTDDRWVQFVRDTLDPDKDAKGPFPVTAAEYFQHAEAVVHITVTWNEGQVGWTEDILKGPKKPYAHMLYASPYGELASQLDPACGYYAGKYEGKAPPSGPRRVEFLAVFEFLPEQEISIGGSLSNCTGGNRDGRGSTSAIGVFSETGNRIYPIDDGAVDVKAYGARPGWTTRTLSDFEVLTLDQVRALTREKN